MKRKIILLLFGIILISFITSFYFNSWQDWNDDFADQNTNQTLWENKTNFCTDGGAHYERSDEVPQGYFELSTRVITGLNTASSWSALRTKQDFNDGKNYQINFTANNSVDVGNGGRVSIFIMNETDNFDLTDGGCISRLGLYEQNNETHNVTRLVKWQNQTFPKTNFTIKIYSNATVIISNDSGVMGTFDISYKTGKWHIAFESWSQAGNHHDYTANFSIFNFSVSELQLSDVNVTLIYPTNNLATTNTSLSFNASVTSTPNNLSNATLYVWNNNGSLFSTNFTTTSNTNSTSILRIIGNFILGNFYKWNYYVCDVAGLCSWASLNWTFSRNSKITTFNNSLSIESITFTGNQNYTRWLRIPKLANVTSAFMNLSGYFGGATSNIDRFSTYRNNSILQGPTDILYEDDILYVPASASNSLVLINVTNKENPNLISYYINSSFMNSPKSVVKNGNYLFIGGYANDSIVVLNVTNKSSPELVKTYTNFPSIDGPLDIAFSSNHIFVINWFNNSLTSINITNITNLTISDYYDGNVIGQPRGIIVENNRAYVSTYTKNISIFNISDPSNLELLDTQNFSTIKSTFIDSMEKDGDLIYIANGGWTGEDEGITIINTSNDDLIFVANYTNLSLQEVTGIAKKGNFLWITSAFQGYFPRIVYDRLTLLNISNLSNISVLNTTVNRTYYRGAYSLIYNNGYLFNGVDSAEYGISITKVGYNPTSPYLEIGSPDGTYEWNVTGEFNTTYNSTSNFNNTIKTALNEGNCDCTGCDVDGSFCLVPFQFHSDTSGILQYSDLNVYYYVSGFVVDLASPSNNSWIPSNQAFNCYLQDSAGLKNVTLKIWNSTGDIYISQSKNITGESNSTIFNIAFNYSDTMKWNCDAWDDFGNNQLSDSNNTIRVDAIFPEVTNISINTTPGSQTFTFSFNATDANLNSCWYSVFNSTGGIDPSTNENTSVACNSEGNSETVSLTSGTFNLTIYANDSAGNINSSTESFTITEISGTSTGGGGVTIISGVSALEAVDFKITTFNLKSRTDISLAKNSKKPRRRQFYVSNSGIEPITVEILCDTQNTNKSSKDINICNYVNIINKTLIVSPNEEERATGIFEVLTPENSSFGDKYFFNILAVRTIDDQKRYSKLSVSTKVSVFSTLFIKWSEIPSLSEDKSRSLIYPSFPVASFVSFIVFILTLLTLKRYEMHLTGFFLGTMIGGATFFMIIFLL